MNKFISIINKYSSYIDLFNINKFIPIIKQKLFTKNVGSSLVIGGFILGTFGTGKIIDNYIDKNNIKNDIHDDSFKNIVIS